MRKIKNIEPISQASQVTVIDYRKGPEPPRTETAMLITQTKETTTEGIQKRRSWKRPATGTNLLCEVVAMEERNGRYDSSRSGLAQGHEEIGKTAAHCGLRIYKGNTPTLVD